MKATGIISCIFSYLFLAAFGYLTYIFCTNYAFESFSALFKGFAEVFTVKIPLWAICLADIVFLFLALLTGTRSHKSLRSEWRENVGCGIFFIMSWLPYFPIFVLKLPFKFFVWLYELDYGGIVYFAIGLIGLALGAYLLYLGCKNGMMSSSMDKNAQVNVLFGWKWSLLAVIIVMGVSLAVYAVCIFTAHFQIKYVYEYSEYTKIHTLFNVLTWILMLPLVVGLFPIAIPLLIGVSNVSSATVSGGSSSNSSYSSSYGSSYGSSGSGGSFSSAPSYDCTVNDGGYTRYLTEIDYKYDNYSGSPFFGSYYTRYKDDAGNYWRSYDGSTLMKETWEQTSRGY